MRTTNCINCGAAQTPYRCTYCGTPEPVSIDWEGIDIARALRRADARNGRFIEQVMPVHISPGLITHETCRQIFESAAGVFDGFRLKDWKPAPMLTAKQSDDEQTAAWYGRGEKPEHEPLDWVRFELIETAKPAKPGLFVVQGEGRYQGLGFNGKQW